MIINNTSRDYSPIHNNFQRARDNKIDTVVAISLSNQYLTWS